MALVENSEFYFVLFNPVTLSSPFEIFNIHKNDSLILQTSF